MKAQTADEGLAHFAQRIGSSCNDDGQAIFILEALYREIDKLKVNKTIGVDRASPVILKRWKTALAKPMLIIFLKSFSEGIVPIQWKWANVSPIHKKSSRKLRSNYIPTSLTSIICKIFESFLRRVMYGHVE